MPRQVQICIPESEIDSADRWGRAVDYDQQIGRLVNEGSTLVEIGGEYIQFPKAWLKHVGPRHNK